MFPFLQETADGSVISLLVQPRASKNQVVGVQGDALKVKLTSPPVDGAANRCCCEYLAGLFSVAKSRVSLVNGEKSRKKKVLLRGVTRQQAADVISALLV